MVQKAARKGWFSCWCAVKSAAATGLLLYVLWLGLYSFPVVEARRLIEEKSLASSRLVEQAPPGQLRAAAAAPIQVVPRPAVAENAAGDAAPTRPPVQLGDSNPSGLAVRKPPPGPGSAGGGATPLVVALASGLDGFEPTLVVINSAVRNAADPSRLHFRIVTAASDAEPLARKLRANLPAGTNLECVNFDPWAPRISRLLGGNSYPDRKELFNSLNFAAFYMHEVFADAERVMYLDTDVVVLADLAEELSELDLGDRPAAGAQDCSQRLMKYIDMDRLRKKGILDELATTLEIKAEKKSCVVNRGVVLIHTANWRRLNITGAIESLVLSHISSRGPLWRSGVSQPPFLLALAGRYHDLGAMYNVRGLGRRDIAPDEVRHYEHQHQWSPYFNQFLRMCQFDCCDGCRGYSNSPYLSPQTENAKILHFNGKNKPSKKERRGTGPVAPPGKQLSREEVVAREQRPLCSCGRDCVQECAGIWWKYRPETIVE